MAFRTPISLSWRRFDLDLTGPARPHGFVSAIGRRAALIGTETGTPLDEPALVAVLDVGAVRPIEVIARFRPDLQLAWPAGFGGQYVFWDNEERAFVLSESRRQVSAFFGSPWATWATNNPSHMLADAPGELHIAVGDQDPVLMPKPGEPAGRFTAVHATGIPIAMRWTATRCAACGLRWSRDKVDLALP